MSATPRALYSRLEAGWLLRCLAAVAVAAAIDVHAQSRVPEVELTAPDGSTAAPGDVVRPGHQLLIVISRDCPPCDRLIRALAGWEGSGVVEGSVVIVRGPARAATTKTDLPGLGALANLRWYVDEQGQMSRALDIRTTPMILGLLNGNIEWRLAGVLNDPASVEPVMRSWVSPRP